MQFVFRSINVRETGPFGVLGITTRHSSPGRKTSAAPGLALLIATAKVSDGCGDFICSVARAHFGRAVCRSFRFSFQKKLPLMGLVSASGLTGLTHRNRYLLSRASQLRE